MAPYQGLGQLPEPARELIRTNLGRLRDLRAGLELLDRQAWARVQLRAGGDTEAPGLLDEFLALNLGGEPKAVARGGRVSIYQLSVSSLVAASAPDRTPT